ncbi:thioredoxin family protein [Kordiimonas aquimaris]|uniref:thioredoxin family protein n=1 Tax=Kordiimonas aquimaris TaxID=707591 RepID=UPI0021D09165|nr:thioredoxin family protein [Kordiimonas aquimaris]
MTKKQQNTKPRKRVYRRILFTFGFVLMVPAIAVTYMINRSSSPIIQGWQEYTPAYFERLMKDGDPILVEVYASWCPICLLQHRALEAMQSDGYKLPANAIRVNFDKNKDFLEQFEFKYTGTMVLFNKGKEVARQTGLTSADKIKAFLSENGL